MGKEKSTGLTREQGVIVSFFFFKNHSDYKKKKKKTLFCRMLQTVRQKHKRKSPTMLSGSTTSSLDPEMYRRTKVCAKTGARNSLSAKKLSFTHSANKKQNGVFFLNRALSISPKASVACSNTSHTNTHKSHYYLASGRHLSLFFLLYQCYFTPDPNCTHKYGTKMIPQENFTCTEVVTASCLPFFRF